MPHLGLLIVYKYINYMYHTECSELVIVSLHLCVYRHKFML